MGSGFTELFWLFLIVAMLQPWVRQKFLEGSRLRAMHRIERSRGSRVILLVHRQETMSLLGFPLIRYININDAEQVIRAIHMTDDDVPIDLVLHTPGGIVLASLQIARAIKAHRGKVTVFVPHYAMSGGTLIALAADEIVMDTHAVLGPVDPQIGEYPAASIARAVGAKDVNEVDDRTLILADVGDKALRQIRAEVLELVEDRMDTDAAAALADKISQGREWTHDHPIGLTQARELGLSVTEEIPPPIYDLMELFPQPTQRFPSVDYIPTPHRQPSPPPGKSGRDR